MNDLAIKPDAKYAMQSGMAPGLAIMFNDVLYERCKDIARIMAEATGFTPPHLIKKSSACFAVVTNSITWKLNPFAVAQSTYETPAGRVGYEGKLVQAILENSGEIEGPVTYEHVGDWNKIRGKWKKVTGSTGKPYAAPDWNDGEENGLGVIVRAKVRGEQTPREFTMWMRECFPRNSTLWALRPSQQICYTACRAFANVAAPGLFMGVPFSSDLDIADMQDITPARPQPADFGTLPEPAAPAQSEPEPGDEYSVADAFAAGRKARAEGRALREVPPEWRDNSANLKFVEGWKEGWRAEDSEKQPQQENQQ